MVTDVELGKSGREVIRVAREEVSMDTIQHIVNLYTVFTMNPIAYHLHG